MNVFFRITAILLAVTICCIQTKRIKDLIGENERLKNNQEAIFAQAQSYKVSDSLNAVRMLSLELTLKEYKRYRAEDAKLIGELKTSKSDLERIVTAQSQTIEYISAGLRDSVHVDTITNHVDTMKCFNSSSRWYDASGCVYLNRDSIQLTIRNRESLKVVEAVRHKRFLGFLWRTSRIKDRSVTIVSENPNTEITKCEFITIKK